MVNVIITDFSIVEQLLSPFEEWWKEGGPVFVHITNPLAAGNCDKALSPLPWQNLQKKKTCPLQNIHNLWKIWRLRSKCCVSWRMWWSFHEQWLWTLNSVSPSGKLCRTFQMSFFGESSSCLLDFCECWLVSTCGCMFHVKQPECHAVYLGYDHVWGIMFCCDVVYAGCSG